MRCCCGDLILLSLRQLMILENVKALLSQQQGCRGAFNFLEQDSVQSALSSLCMFCLFQEARKRGLQLSWVSLRLSQVGLPARGSVYKLI